MFTTKFYALCQKFLSIAYLVLKSLQSIVQAGWYHHPKLCEGLTRSLSQTSLIAINQKKNIIKDINVRDTSGVTS